MRPRIWREEETVVWVVVMLEHQWNTESVRFRVLSTNRRFGYLSTRLMRSSNLRGGDIAMMEISRIAFSGCKQCDDPGLTEVLTHWLFSSGWRCGSEIEVFVSRIS